MQLKQYTGAPTRYFNFENFENEVTVDIIAQFISEQFISEHFDSIENKITIPAEQFINFLTNTYFEKLEQANQIPNQITQEIEKSIAERIFSAIKLDFTDTKEIKVNNPAITPEILTLKSQRLHILVSGGSLILQGIKYLVDQGFITILNKQNLEINYLQDAETIIINQKLLERL